ncbi:hypothetical protein C3V39_09775 [Prevotella sp. oral taxon 820]|nr:hypothetical protein C3V39_09775 [Prevotella sp. oral taxon 820]
MLIIVGWYVWTTKPYNEQQMKRSISLVERKSYFVLYAADKPVIMFSGFSRDSIMEGFSFSEDSISGLTFVGGGFWVNRYPWVASCSGRMIAAVNDMPEIVPIRENVPIFLYKEIAYLKENLSRMRDKLSELRYYLRVHGVQDEGYDVIAKYTTRLRARIDTAQKALDTLRTIKRHTPVTIIRKNTFTAKYPDESGRWNACDMRVLKYSDDMRYAVLQTVSAKSPDSIQPLSLLPWNAGTKGAAVGVSYLTTLAGKSYGVLMDGTLDGDGKHNFSDFLMKDGHPVFSAHGSFVGMKQGKTVISRNELNKLLTQGDDENN